MSVYSGFATRQMEQKYNHLIKTLLIILAKRINKIYTNKPCNEEAFQQILLKVLCHMSLMERHKYMQPKFTESVAQLVEIFQPSQPFIQLTQPHLPTDIRPNSSKPPLRPTPIKFEEMPRQPSSDHTSHFNVQIKQTQDQINNLQQNLNNIIGTRKDSQKLVINVKDDSVEQPSFMLNANSRYKDSQSELKQEEIQLIQNMIKQRKQKRKSKGSKPKRKKCTFEKLLLDFYNDDQTSDQFDLAVPQTTQESKREPITFIRRSTAKTRSHSLYR